MIPEYVMDEISLRAVGSFTTKPRGCGVPAARPSLSHRSLWSGEGVRVVTEGGCRLPVTPMPDAQAGWSRRQRRLLCSSWMLGLSTSGICKGPRASCRRGHGASHVGLEARSRLGRGEEAREVVTVGPALEKLHLRKVNCAHGGQRTCPLFQSH